MIYSYFRMLLKLSLSVGLYYSGIIDFFSDNKTVRILTYHKINNDDFDPLNMCVAVSSFEKQMKFLQKNYNVVSLRQAINLLKDERMIPKRTLVITFDDGYKDNYTNALPILKKYGLPATIFLSVNAIEKREMLWYDIVTRGIKESKKNIVYLPEFFEKEYELSGLREKYNATKEIVSFGKTLPIQERSWFIKSLLDTLEVEYERFNNDNHMLTWQDIKEMQRNNIDFGSHGLSHCILTNLSQNEISYEIAESRGILMKRIGANVDFFSYPNGGKNDFDNTIVTILAKKGYIASCSLLPGSNDLATDIFALRRICITEGCSSGLANMFSTSLFAAKISGLF